MFLNKLENVLEQVGECSGTSLVREYLKYVYSHKRGGKGSRKITKFKVYHKTFIGFMV